MSYTPPVTFVAGNPVTDADINTNNDALRKYINRDVVVGDLATDSFGTTEIVKGEYYNVVPDHQFTTGDLYTQAVVDDIGSERHYYTSTTKTRLGAQWASIGQYQIIVDTGKSIYFEGNNGTDIANGQAAKLIITGHIGVRNYYQYTFDSTYNTQSAEETKFYLLFKIEGLPSGASEWLKIDATKAQVLGFEDFLNSTSGVGTCQPNDRRVIPFLYEVDIPNLWTSISPAPMPQNLAWRFAIGVESQIDLGWVNNRFMTYEVFYA